ncbi:thyrotropin-releasing hormone receptor-like isoform X1 [Mytilus californianus]|uniref:thyrotropin-releasing hormone receptor-like isoform X1 n=1 Tax=Mytilus californianus TaxID=6549 RepID=UPI0022460811|nr:thyrotropin-releasing hormone receptor-like isoform X1 [Mytilus californianus]
MSFELNRVVDTQSGLQEFEEQWSIFSSLVKNTSMFENVTFDLPKDSAPRYIETLQQISPEVLLIDRIISPVWYVIGFIGNPLSAAIWFGRSNRKNSSAVYQGILAIVNIYFLIVHLIMELNYAWGIQLYASPGACETFSVFLMIPQYLSPMLVLAFTIERYIAVCHPFQKKKFCTVKRALMVSTCMFIISAGLSSVQAYLWDYDDKIKLCAFLSFGHQKFEKIWTLVTEILHFLLIPLCVLIFNILVIIEIRKIDARDTTRLYSGHSGRATTTSTVTLLSVSFYFICTLLPASIVYAMQSLLPYGNKMSVQKMVLDPTWRKYLQYLMIRKVVEEICLSNQACYFFIYYLTGSLFRKRVHNMCCKSPCCRKKPKSELSNEYAFAMYTPVASNDLNANSQEETKISM